MVVVGVDERYPDVWLYGGRMSSESEYLANVDALWAGVTLAFYKAMFTRYQEICADSLLNADNIQECD